MRSSMQTRWLKRTVLIGLGGTGKKALLHAKRKFVETFGEVPPLVKFLLVDTTSAHTDGLQAASPQGDRVTVRLNPSEVLFIEARGASLLPQVHDEVREWFPPKAELKANILSGAGQIRALGRLALFANARIVYDSLRALLSDARNYQAERPSSGQNYVYESYTPHLTVCVVGSLAGGTGSGIFLDIALILRDLLKDEDQLFGYLLLPDIYTNRPGTQNVEANAYGALKELDDFMSLKETRRYPFGGRTVEVRKKPFDMVFLVNRQNRGGKTFNSVEDLAELLGMGIFLVSGPLGKEQADVFDNIVMQLTEQQGSYYGKTAHYASFGAAEMRFEPHALDRERAVQAAGEAVAQLTRPARPWGISSLELFLESIKTVSMPPVPDKLPRAAASRSEDRKAWEQAQAEIDTVKAEEQEAARQAIAAVWPLEQTLDEALREAFKSHSVADLAQGLQQLQHKAAALVKELKAEHEQKTRDEEHFREKVGRELESGESLRRGLFGLRPEAPGEPRVNRRTLKVQLERAVFAVHAKARLEAAERSVKLLRGKLEKLEELLRTLDEWAAHFRRGEGDPAAGLQQDAHPFTLTLPPPYLHSEPVGASDFPDALDQLRATGLDLLLRDAKAVLDSVFAPTERTSLRDWLNEVKRREPNDPLRMAVERALRELDALSAPAWEYQDAWVSNPKVGQREQVHILGVDDASDKDHPLLHGEFQDIFAGNIHAKQKLQPVSTGDPKRVYFYKIEASIPAFTLWGLEMYREKYESLSASRSFHLHRDWEGTLPDLLPLPDPQDVARVWTKARLFGLIRHDPKYAYKSDREGVERWRALGPGPSNAFETLCRDFFGYKELEGKVGKREAEARRGQLAELLAKVGEALDDRRRRLQATDRSEADRRVLEREVGALEEWLKQLEEYDPSLGEDSFPVLSLT